MLTINLNTLWLTFQPGFVRRYASLADTAGRAVERFSRDVKSGRFPGRSESRRLKDPSILKDLT